MLVVRFKELTIVQWAPMARLARELGSRAEVDPGPGRMIMYYGSFVT